MERNNTLSKELEECRTKLTVATAELENLKKSKEAHDGKYSNGSEIRFRAYNDIA